MLCAPEFENTVPKMAFPAASSGVVAIGTNPSKKVMAPVGVPAVEVTMAVNETIAPAETDPGTADRVVTVGFAATTTVTTGDVLEAKSEFPTKIALMLCDPALSNAVSKIPTPLPSRTAVPSVTVPS
jgi:hypothetical protein